MATFFQKVKLLKGLYNGDMARTGPFYVDVDITNRCNLRCLGCQYHSPYLKRSPLDNSNPADIKLEMFKHICEELKKMYTTRSLILKGGGEPLLHPKICEIISTAKEAGFHVTLFTNGTLLNRDLIEALIEARPDILRVSLWASSKEQYQQNYPDTDPVNFTKVVEGLNLFSEIKALRKSVFPFVYLHNVINCYNFQTTDDFIDLANRTGCEGVFFSPMWSDQGALHSFVLSTKEEKFMQQSLLRLRKLLQSLRLDHNIDQVLLRFKVGAKVWEKVPCYISWIYSRIGYDGEIYPCCRCHKKLGNLYKNTFYDVWNGPAIRAFRKQTLTHKGLASMSQYCNCKYCSFVVDNLRVHRLFRWFSPFSVMRNGKVT